MNLCKTQMTRACSTWSRFGRGSIEEFQQGAAGNSQRTAKQQVRLPHLLQLHVPIGDQGLARASFSGAQISLYRQPADLQGDGKAGPFASA